MRLPVSGGGSCPVKATGRWIDSVVIGLALCPWAKPTREDGSLRLVDSAAASPAELALDLAAEIELLQRDAAIETTVLIHPLVFTDDFMTYTGWVSEVECWLGDQGLSDDFLLVAFVRAPCLQPAPPRPRAHPIDTHRPTAQAAPTTPVRRRGRERCEQLDQPLAASDAPCAAPVECLGCRRLPPEHRQVGSRQSRPAASARTKAPRGDGC